MDWVQKCLTGLIETGELSAKDAFELYTQKGAQIDYDAKKKELQEFYDEYKEAIHGLGGDYINNIDINLDEKSL